MHPVTKAVYSVMYAKFRNKGLVRGVIFKIWYNLEYARVEIRNFFA